MFFTNEPSGAGCPGCCFAAWRLSFTQPLAAQTLGFGSDPGSTFGGLRGTVDATGSNPTLSGQGAPGASARTGPLAGFNPKRQAQTGVPKLRNGALPEQYPVPLPALQPYPASVRRLRGALPDQGNVVDPNVAALPTETRRIIRPDDAPFAPIGYEAGSLRLSPYVEQSLGYDSNPDQTSTLVKASPYSRTEAGFALQSQWSAHELTGAMRGAYDDFFRNPQSNRPDANGVLDLRIDATRDTAIDTEARFTITDAAAPARRNSTSTSSGVPSSRPLAVRSASPGPSAASPSACTPWLTAPPMTTEC